MRSAGKAVQRAAARPALLWTAFLLVHVALAAVNLYDLTSNPIGDIRRVYFGWAQQSLDGTVVGIDTPFVYPILALPPMLASAAFGWQSYAHTWMLLVVVADALAFAVLLHARRVDGEPWRARVRAAWWWIAFLALLGPIALGRIDALTVPLAIAGLLAVAGRPALAAVLLTVGAWVKVWPAALVGAALVACRTHRRRILGAAVVVSAAVVLVALVLGSGGNVLSFVTEQTGRGLQIESPVSTPWLWLAQAGGDASIYYDRGLLTFQVRGAGVDLASALMTPLQGIAVLVVVLLGVRATRRGAEARDLLPVLALALVVALIAFHKVGSPQFTCWIVAPIVLGLLTRGRPFAVPAVLGLVLALLTQVVYPVLYGLLLDLSPAMLTVLTLRNALWFVLLGWAVAGLWKAGTSRSPHRGPVVAQREGV
jgi:Glycosyltransferase family 87